jgi:DNA-binding GntR family transcriptional regulator
MKATERVYTTLKQEIQDHTLQPGMSISIVDTAKRLETSPTPVREAIGRLEQEGLIVSRNGRKSVFTLTGVEITQIFDLKKAIECSIVRLAVDRGGENDFEELRRVVEEAETLRKSMGSAADHSDAILPRWLELDRSFHDRLYEMSANSKAQEIVALLNLQWHRYRIALLSLPGVIEKNIDDHLAVGRAILARDGFAAAVKTEEHLEEVRRALATVANLISPGR